MGHDHGHRLWIYDTHDQQTVAFILDGMEYLREMLPEHKRNRSLRRNLIERFFNRTRALVDASPLGMRSSVPTSWPWSSSP